MLGLVLAQCTFEVPNRKQFPRLDQQRQDGSSRLDRCCLMSNEVLPREIVRGSGKQGDPKSGDGWPVHSSL